MLCFCGDDTSSYAGTLSVSIPIPVPHKNNDPSTTKANTFYRTSEHATV